MLRALPSSVTATHDDMGVGMTSVVMIDCDPVQPRFQIALHLVDQLAGKPAKVAQLDTILRRYDKAELMWVVHAPVEKGRTIGMVECPAIELAGLSLTAHPVALEITHMRIARPASRSLELHYAGFDDHPAHSHPLARTRVELPAIVARQGPDDFGATAVGVVAAVPRLRLAPCRGRFADALGIPSRARHRVHDLALERSHLS